jgi:hypothetical protein
MKRYLLRKLDAREGESGITMVVVLVTFTIIIAMVLGSLSLIANSTKHSRHQQDTDLALAAAESGVNDLLTLLRGDPSYLNAISAPADAYCDNDATGGSDQDYFAGECGWGEGTATGWKDLAGGRQRFHYVIEDYNPVTEQLVLLSTGRGGDVYRTIRAYLGRETTEHFLYFTDYELADPNDYTTYTTWINKPSESAYGPEQLTSEGCGGTYPKVTDGSLGYKWQIGAKGSKVGREYHKMGFNYPCQEPDFIKDDVLEGGKIHSNDTIRSSDATFKGPFSTADPACANATEVVSTWNNCVSGKAQSFASKPTYVKAPKQLPPTDDAEQEAREKDAGGGGRGCLYQGPTRVLLRGDRMTVWSKDTSQAREGCGTVTALRSAAGADVEIPTGQDALVWVAAAPGVAKSQIRSGAIGNGLPRGDYNPATHTAAGAGKTYKYERAMTLPKMWDGIGNLFIEGKYSTSLTVGASGTVVITGDMVADEPDTQLLGVISKGSIEVFNPIVATYQSVKSSTGYLWAKASEGELDATWKPADHSYDKAGVGTFSIHAALYAASAGFGLQNWNLPEKDLGTLYVYGSIAQRFRGIVGYYSDQATRLISGYHKHYEYNKSLAKNSPLLFSPISNASWVVGWTERADPSQDIKD